MILGNNKKYILLIYSIISVFQFSCNKIIEIPPPNNSITTSQVFADSADAAAAISGIYSSVLLGNYGMSFCNGSQTILCGMSSDELVNFNASNSYNTEFYFNSLESKNGTLSFLLWSQPYTYIYQANAAIEGLENSKNLSQSVKNQFLGEAKFFRALFYFYLVNLYGDVPYITSTGWAQTDTVSRSPRSLIYQNMVSDLKEAKKILPVDFSYSQNQRTRANKPVVAALLARIYLYQQDWQNAELEADSLINNSLFSLAPDLNGVFWVNSNEAILQWQLNTSFGLFCSTNEGHDILPADSTSPPGYYLSSQLLNAFEPGDQRKSAWVDSTTYFGTTYYYPYKYKNGVAQEKPKGTPSEYYTVFRLAEQYLIRAEAKANLGNDLTGAASDLNMIRTRAGLSNTSATSQTELLNAVAQERRIELFTEWGHRWFDLKRMGKVDSVMAIVTPQKHPGSAWQSYQQFYPIPLPQLNLNSFLRQNPGY